MEIIKGKKWARPFRRTTHFVYVCTNQLNGVVILTIAQSAIDMSSYL